MKRQFFHLVLALLMMMAIPWIAAQAQDNGASSESWGGRGVTMTMSAQGATLEFDCAHGAILQAIKPNAEGEFSAAGTYTPEMGGPVRKDNPPRDLPATYKGTIHGDAMELEVLLNDKNMAPPSMTLTRGSLGRLHKCR